VVNSAPLPLHPNQRDGVSSGKVTMDTNVFEEYQNQFAEWQKEFFDAWIENLPNGKTALNFSENFEKALTFQQELVKSYLDIQRKTTEMMLEAQKQFWADYFEKLRKEPATTAK
jgi:hypothetical protein